MSTDPVQMLIDAGAIPSSPFDAASRYHGVPLAVLPQPDGAPGIAYARRRFLPALRDVAVAGRVSIAAGDRPDLIAHRAYADPAAWWRVADANGVADSFELTDTPGARIVIPVVQGG